MLCALLMSRICRRFSSGEQALTALDLRQETTIPIRFVKDLLYELISAGLLIEINSDEKGEESRFVPSEDINNLTLGVLIDRLESRGQWKVDLDVSTLLTSEWGKAMEMRMSYLKDARTIRLQDL